MTVVNDGQLITVVNDGFVMFFMFVDGWWLTMAQHWETMGDNKHQSSAWPVEPLRGVDWVMPRIWHRHWTPPSSTDTSWTNSGWCIVHCHLPNSRSYLTNVWRSFGPYINKPLPLLDHDRSYLTVKVGNFSRWLPLPVFNTWPLDHTWFGSDYHQQLDLQVVLGLGG